jgi:hypothetical protein
MGKKHALPLLSERLFLRKNKLETKHNKKRRI